MQTAGPAFAGFDEPQLAQLVNFTARAHNSCAAFDDHYERKMTARTEAEAVQSAIAILDRVPTLMELGKIDALAERGYAFAGLGPCRVPGPGKSVHLIYRATDNPAALPVSLFIQKLPPDTPELTAEQTRQLKKDTCLLVSGKPCPEATDKREQVDTDDASTARLVIWRDGGFMYYLFVPDTEMRDAAREALGAPEQALVV